MCGIAGILTTDPWSDQLTASLTGMQAALRHRGPDDQGLWVAPAAGVGLAHTRLAILDLSPAGHQPMASADGRYQIVFNGEIYNFRELRAELERAGGVFQTGTDTEVLLQHLIRHGERGLEALAGMFAFCLWDNQEKRAWLARDAFGIKPLYYRASANDLWFASETKALRRGDEAPDASALRDFLLWGSVPEPQTLWRSVRQLEAGHSLTYCQRTGERQIQRWFSPPQEGAASASLTNEQAASLTRAALEESLDRHLVSDAPLGFFLSGGIDSTAVVALARQRLGPRADLRTFSIGFAEEAFDESATAQRTAAHFGSQHVTWQMTEAEGRAEIPAFLAAVDQPSIDGFNTWCVSKLAAQHGVKVVLSGLGGDELFGGYGSFQRVPALRAWYGRLGPCRWLIAMALQGLPSGTPWRRLAAFLRGGGSWLEAYQTQRGIFTPAEADHLAFELTGENPQPSRWDTVADDSHPLQSVALLEQTRYLRNQLLRDSDVFSMAHGLELRVPLVDARLSRALAEIPPSRRLRAGKRLLVEAVPELPEWVLQQPKRGFRFPFQQWMEGTFAAQLTAAQQRTTTPLKAWYRTWAVALALRQLDHAR